VWWISWCHADESHASTLRHTIEVIASYVKAGVRIHLYTYLDILQKRALYTDTDSLIYIQPRDGAALVKTGDCLGHMTSELNNANIYLNS